MIDFTNDKIAADNLVLKVKELKKEISKVIIGQDEVVNGLIISILSNGHALLIGVPGLAKTGPLLNLKFLASSKISEPIISLGIKSGVN